MAAPKINKDFVGISAGDRAGVALAGLLTAFSPSAAANAQDVAALAAKPPPGKHVVLRVGPLFNPVLAAEVAATLPPQCTHEITTEGGVPRNLIVDVVGGRSGIFKNSGEAGNFADRHCTSVEPK